jgi:hypothetical protein
MLFASLSVASSGRLDYRSTDAWASLISSHRFGFAIVEFDERSHDGVLEFSPRTWLTNPVESTKPSCQVFGTSDSAPGAVNCFYGGITWVGTFAGKRVVSFE